MADSSTMRSKEVQEFKTLRRFLADNLIEACLPFSNVSLQQRRCVRKPFSDALAVFVCISNGEACFTLESCVLMIGRFLPQFFVPIQGPWSFASHYTLSAAPLCGEEECAIGWRSCGQDKTYSNFKCLVLVLFLWWLLSKLLMKVWWFFPKQCVHTMGFLR